MGHQAFTFRHRETLFNRTLNTNQTYTELVLGHLTDGADTTVAEVIDIINNAFTVTNINQTLKNRDDIFFVQRAAARYFLTTQTTVELHAAYA